MPNNSKTQSELANIAENADLNFKELRIVVFSDAFRHRNGVGAYYCDLLESFKGKIGESELICPGPAPAGSHQPRQGLSIPLPGDNTQRLCLPGVIKARRVMRKIKPHVVILAAPGPYGLLGLIMAKIYKAKLCIGYHTQYDKLVSLYWNRVFGPMAERYLRGLDKWMFKRARVVLTNSRPMETAAWELGSKDVRLVGTPVEPRMLAPVKAPPDKQFGPVLFVGRLAGEKNLDVFLEAAERLPQTKFIIAGDGPLADEITAAAENLKNLDYVGWVNREDLVKVLDNSEMLVLPSTIESFGTVAIEAMARARMVMVSEHCGITEWPELSPGVEVLYDGEHLADALQKYIDMPLAERHRKRLYARTHCEKFAMETIANWQDTLLEVARQG
ncbi:MAG: glycosyltransferase [Lentisphaeria bacterium]